MDRVAVACPRRLTAKAAVPPDGWPQPLVLTGYLEGVQRLAECTEELPEFTEAVHAAHQEGLERHVRGTLGPGGTLEGSVAGCLGSLKVFGTAFSIHDLLLFHLDAVLFNFVATRTEKARTQKSWAWQCMPVTERLEGAGQRVRSSELGW